MADDTAQEQEDRGDLVAVDELQMARDEWDRVQWAVDTGHGDYVEAVRRNFRYYRGDGGQWSDADREYMESVQGRKCIEINGILPSVQTAVGEQIATRVDIVFRPKRGQASQEIAEILSKIAKHDLTQNTYPRIEKQVFKDGLIKRRGWIDVRLDFDGNINGEVKIAEVDPLTVIPDPHITTYDPKDWPGVTKMHWLSLDEIEGMFGSEARAKVERTHTLYDENPYYDLFGSTNRIDNRYGFSDKGIDTYMPPHMQEAGETRYRIIERQFYRMSFSLHWVDRRTGDVFPIPENMGKDEFTKIAMENNYLVQRMNKKRLRWRVCSALTVLHDEWSPYRTPTLIPFFYLFDYGHTLGMVDNAISAQDLQNKAISSELHILTSVSNSGWKVPKRGEKSCLTNMTPETLKSVGMSSGLVLEYDPEVGTPDKILPNDVPTGHDRLSEKGEYYVKVTTGISDAERGMNSPEVSGVAIQSKQMQTKLQLADPLDNLQATRILLGRKILELRQDFATAEQIFAISKKDQRTGKEEQEQVIVNRVDATGRVLNDITVGEYDVDIATAPLAATYEETQFRQAVTLRSEAGVALPDDEIVRLSNLDNKYELAERLANPNDNGVAAAQAKLLESQIGLNEAKRRETIAKAANTNIQAMFGATNAGRVIATVPGVAPLADELMLSAGFEDANAAPVIPGPATPQLPAPDTTVPEIPNSNTSPNFPPQADQGVTAGIEGGQA